MSLRYDQEAIEYCRGLYHHYGGKNLDAIEADMQKVYPGWRRSNLQDRKKRKGDKVAQLGWINRYGFDRSLEIYLRSLQTSVGNDEQSLYLGIKTVRERLEKKVCFYEGEPPTRDEVYQYRDFCNLEIAARKALDLSRDNLDTFVSGYEKLLKWLGELDPAAAKQLLKNGDRLVELAQAHYGSTEEVGDGTEHREDEGGEQPGRNLRLVG